MRSFFSNTTTLCPARASCCAQASPAGPEPTTATRFSVLTAAGRGLTQPCSHALSMIACSIDLMPTASLLMRRVHASSQGAGTDAAGEFREIIGRMQRFDRVLPVLPENEVVEVGDDVVDRAAAHAKRDAAIHAARALNFGLVIAQVQHELAIVLFARILVFAGFVQPLVFEKSCNLAHVLWSAVVDVRPRLSCRWRQVRSAHAGILSGKP